MKTRRVKALVVTAVLGVSVVGTQQAHAGCTTVAKDRAVASGGQHLASQAVAYERCVV